MNRWNEFDYIKTPEEWKDIPLDIKKHQPKYRLSFIMMICVIIISITTVVAYHEELEEWLRSYFHSENVYKIENTDKIKVENLLFVSYKDALIAYEYDQDDMENIQKIYLVKNHQFSELNPSSIKGIYENKEFSFRYVRYKDSIFSYDYQGIDEVLPYIQDDNVYIMTPDNNLASFNLNNKEIVLVTHDNESVNPIMSPTGQTILINKSDKYWTVYDTQAKTEKIVKDIEGYALSNELRFIDDYTVCTYHTCEYEENNYTTEVSEMYVIDLKTFDKKVFKDSTEFATCLVIDESEQSIKIKNILTYQTCSIPTHHKTFSKYMTDHYVLFYNDDKKENKGYLYSINDNKYIEIDMPKGVGNIEDMNIIDESKELFFTDGDHFYFIDISHMFDK